MARYHCSLKKVPPDHNSPGAYLVAAQSVYVVCYYRGMLTSGDSDTQCNSLMRVTTCTDIILCMQLHVHVVLSVSMAALICTRPIYGVPVLPYTCVC